MTNNADIMQNPAATSNLFNTDLEGCNWYTEEEKKVFHQRAAATNEGLSENLLRSLFYYQH